MRRCCLSSEVKQGGAVMAVGLGPQILVGK